jgi:hypothetical protein
VADTVRLTVAPDEGQAELICGMLRAEGIRCFHRTTDISAGVEAALARIGQWREILVLADDFLRARELVENAEPIVEDCARCGRAVGEDGGWFLDQAGELQPYCGVCAERLFGPV